MKKVIIVGIVFVLFISSLHCENTIQKIRDIDEKVPNNHTIRNVINDTKWKVNYFCNFQAYGYAGSIKVYFPLAILNKLCPINWLIFWLTNGYPLIFSGGIWFIKNWELYTKGLYEWKIEGKSIAFTFGFIGIYVFLPPRYSAVFGFTLFVIAKEVEK